MPGDESINLPAAELRADRSEIAVSVEALASSLEQALPGLATVERQKVGGFRSKRREVRRIAVALGDEQFELRAGAHAFECSRQKVVRGITLSRQQLDMSEWLAELLAGVSRSAEVSQQNRIALQELLA